MDPYKAVAINRWPRLYCGILSRDFGESGVNKKCIAILAGSLCAALGSSLWAQDNLARFQRTLDQLERTNRIQADESVPMDQRALIDYGAYINALFVAFPDPGDTDHILQQYEGVAFGRVNLDGAHEFFVRGRYANKVYSDNSRPPDESDHDNQIDRLYYRFDLQRYLASSKGEDIGGDLAIQGGRQLVNWANGLVLSQEIDGGIIDANYGNASAEFIGGRTYYYQTDIDPNRPNYIDDMDRMLWGGLFSYQLPKHKPFLYFLHQQDQNGNPVSTTPGPTGPIMTRYHYNSWYLGGGSEGEITDNLLYTVEMTYEGGSNLSNSTGGLATQSSDAISAFGADARLDYLFTDAHKTRWTEEFIAASGDSDRGVSNSTLNGNKANTNDNGFNAFGLLNTGVAFAPAVSNLLVLRSGVTTYPWPDTKTLDKLQLGADVLLYSKFESSAPIDEPTHDDWWLGTELDLSATWQITSDLSLMVRYGLFFPGSALTSDSDPRNFVAVGVTYAF